MRRICKTIMKRLFIFILPLLLISCKGEKQEYIAEPVIEPMLLKRYATKIQSDINPFTWSGTKLESQKLYDINAILNNNEVNPGLKSPCQPPSAGNPTVRYEEHYRCGSFSVLESACVLWNDVVPIKNGSYRESKLSSGDLNEIMLKAVNYANIAPPMCRCQKVPAHVYRYNIQSTSYINGEHPDKPLTRRLWITTTYNCCGPCK